MPTYTINLTDKQLEALTVGESIVIHVYHNGIYLEINIKP